MPFRDGIQDAAGLYMCRQWTATTMDNKIFHGDRAKHLPSMSGKRPFFIPIGHFRFYPALMDGGAPSKKLQISEKLCYRDLSFTALPKIAGA